MPSIVLPEVVAVGVYNAQLVIKNRTVTKNRKTTMFEIDLPIADGGISYLDEEACPIRENTVICAKPEQIRHTSLPFKCYYIHMIVGEGALYDLLMGMPNFIEITQIAELRGVYERMCESYQLGTSQSELMLHSLILELVFLLDKAVGATDIRRRAKRSNREIIEKTVEKIKSDLSAAWTLTRLAKEANFTPVYFHKLFKTATGKTLREFVEELRIRKSIDLLVSTDKTLTEIAYECGFSSQAYFSYAFKKKMKAPPREYAKRLLERYEK